MKSQTHNVVIAGLEQGLKNRIAKIFENLSTAGEGEREKRFRTGVANAVAAFERAYEIVNEDVSS